MRVGSPPPERESINYDQKKETNISIMGAMEIVGNSRFLVKWGNSGGGSEMTSGFVYCNFQFNTNLILRFYATFKVRKVESLFYKTNTCLQKTTTCIGLRAEQIFSVNI